jgi:glyoxylase-like metal-dependent hydrolase (beta-lactamase superfamily II)
MRDITVGRLRVSAVVETAGPTRATWLFPGTTAEALDRHRDWLAPHFLDAESRLLQSVHTFVVRTPDLTVLVDTCIGNDKDRGGRRPFHMLRTGFLDTLKAAGVAPDAVDVVICTHLHVDHVGWNTRLENGRWVPTFPRARYLFARREWEHWTAESEEGTQRIMGDSVAPVLDAGLAELVDMDHRVTDEIGLEPTPGHTPGHVSVRLASGGADAVITGDLMHHPVQIAEPTWQTTFDTDPDAARDTRRAFCARYGDRPVTVLGTHFHHPTAGRIVKHGDTWRFALDKDGRGR